MKKIIIYYFLFLLSLLSIFSSGLIDSQDGFQYLAVARNIYYKGEPVAPPYEYDTRENVHMSIVIGKDGKTYSLTGLGYSLAYLPAVAITDMVYKFYGVSPPVHFPLENDWLISLTASFTNSFFGAMLGVILFLYLLELGLSKKQAIFISLVGLFSTNLLVYTKHSFPHMMFTAFLFLSFYLVKIHFKTKRKIFLIFSGISFGITIITYNIIAILALAPLGSYFILLTKFRFDLKSIKSLIAGSTLFLIGLVPFIFIYFWFENLRATPTINLSSSTTTTAVVSFLTRVPLGVFFEGIYGQLFSPGRSIFLYSPILLLIILFWHKIKKNLAELWVFLILSVLYISFYSTLYNPGDPTSIPAKGVVAYWHGEYSWGPRYLAHLIPFGILLVGGVYVILSKKAKLLIFYSLVIFGLYIQILGILMPYQIKFHELEDRFFVNNTEYVNSLYTNLLPRYSPVFMMSKKLVKLYQTLPRTLDHGLYNVRFYDGIDFPFSVGAERWRAIEDKGYISFDNIKASPVKKITLGLINHPIEEASYSAVIQILLNDHEILEQEEVLLPTERKLIELNMLDNYLEDKNLLVISTRFKSVKDSSLLSETSVYKDDPALYENKNLQPKKHISQILGIISFSINGHEVNKESLDFPYVSSLGPAITGKSYQNYGGFNNDPWKTWHIHTQIYERVPDFWWVKTIYYWDIPKMPIYLLLFFIVCISIYSGLKTFRSLSK